MIGLLDCNNFFVSCERVFNPKLLHKPVIVLSSNDGCVIARSNEAKTLGIKMGEPFFRIKDSVDKGLIEVRSSNLTLYGDMSNRVMSIIRRFVPHIEIYSIDEAFLDLSGIPDIHHFGQELNKTIRQWTGIPVSLGVAPTKTLAKVASRFAKKYIGYKGCCLIDNDEKRTKALQLLDIADVWGIGRKHLTTLNYYGIHTAYDLLQWSEARIRRTLSLPGVRTWTELQGIPSIPIEPVEQKKSITTSRSFREPITAYESLRAFVAEFTALSAIKLRKQGSRAGSITVFIGTDRFRQDIPQYHNGATRYLSVPTSDPRELIQAGVDALEEIYRSGYGFKRAGVSLGNFSDNGVQMNFFDPIDRVKQERLLQAVDKIYLKNGQDVLRIASQGTAIESIRREYRSGCFTTNPKELIKVYL